MRSVVMLLAFAATAAAGESPASKVVVDAVPFDDISELLHINKRSGHVIVPKGAPVGRLVIEFYQGGEKLPQSISGAGYSNKVAGADNRRVDFSVQAADLDWLHLGDGPKGHCRVRFKVVVGGMLSALEAELPKSTFDFSLAGSGGAFTTKAGLEDKVPLYYWVAEANEFHGSDTVESVVKLNAKGKVAILYLRLGKE